MRRQMRFVLMGAGGFSVEVADLVTGLGHDVVACYDEIATSLPDGLSAPIELVDSLDGLDCDAAALAVGSGELLERFFALADERFEVPVLVHPTASVSPGAQLGAGTLVMQNAVVNAASRVGRGTIVNVGAIVAHHGVVGDWVHLAPYSVVSGRAGIGAKSMCGTSSVLLPGVTVGDRSVCGAGAIVTRDVGDDAVVIGIPARIMKKA